MKSNVKHLCGLALIIVVTLIPFGRSIQYGIVNCDDYDYVPHAYLEPLRVADVEMAIWMPVTWASYKLDYWLAGVGKDAATNDFERAYRVMHGHSVLVHGVNAALLFLLLTMLFKGRTGWCACLVGALVWALHPLRCESVCWIASRKDVLSMCGLLTALICWMKFRVATKRSNRWGWYAGALGSFVLGAACKPSAMLFTPLAFILDWLVTGHVNVVEHVRRAKKIQAGYITSPTACSQDLKALLRKMAGDYLPYVIPGMISIGLAFFAAWAQAAGGAMDLFGNLPLSTRLANAAAAFGIYLKNTMWPFDLAAFSRYRCPDAPRFFAPGVCLTLLTGTALTFFCMRLIRNRENRFERGRYLFAALLWFCTAIFPFIGIKAFGVEPFADRFTYIPSVGWSLPVVAVLSRAKWWTWGLACAVLLGLGVRSFGQTGIWENDRTLWEQTIAVDGDQNAVAWANLGLWYFEYPHDLAKAEKCFHNSVKYDDDISGRIYEYYIYTLCEQGKIDDAGKIYARFASWDARKVRKWSTNPQTKDTAGFIGARLVYLFNKDETREQALAEMKELIPSYKQRKLYSIFYASYLLGVTTKEELSAIPHWDYVRFRFVKGHGKP